MNTLLSNGISLDDNALNAVTGNSAECKSIGILNLSELADRAINAFDLLLQLEYPRNSLIPGTLRHDPAVFCFELCEPLMSRRELFPLFAQFCRTLRIRFSQIGKFIFDLFDAFLFAGEILQLFFVLGFDLRNLQEMLIQRFKLDLDLILFSEHR